ncbi:MAG: hypothetical protein H6732_13750 [Alphaproteobacteria bacterium]|nr:hypothetical protein [Alphaproteobacteria bacterium]
MTFADGVLFAVVILIAANHLVLRVERLVRSDLAFWSVCTLDVLAGTAVLGVGLPGLEAVRPASWVLGLLLFLHVAQNVSVRGRILGRLRDAEEDARRLRAEALRSRVRED